MTRKASTKIFFIVLIFLVIPFFSNTFLINSNLNGVKENIDIEELRSSSVVSHPNNLWIENPTFSGLGEPWYSIIEGDTTDVKGNLNLNQANIEVIGDSGGKYIDEPLNDTDWTATNNPDLPILPDFYEINSSGAHVSHLWHENINQTTNRPSVHWKRTISMPVDMRDYVITSAFLEVEFNATVTVSPAANGIDRSISDSGVLRFSTGDYAEFYVLISDEEETIPAIQVAHNNTADLGIDSPPLGNYSDSPMDTIPENVLIDVLTSVLNNDGYNFTITLGIDIYCEDNIPAVDIDTWDSLIIRSFNLSFTYEKKIDQFTTGSWVQVGDKISGNNIQVTHANLTFKYKVDRTWPVISSPNSEIRILINNNTITETIKLSTGLTSFKDAKEGGYDVTSYILKDVNISLSIQVFLADEFSLDQNITISIDDVYFTISYIEIFSDIFSEQWFFTALLVFASFITIIIGGYLVAYQRILKYPRPVRKVRRFKRNLDRKTTPEIGIIPREIAFKKAYNQELTETSKLLNLKQVSLRSKISTIKERFMKPTEIIPSKEVKSQMTSDQLITKSLEKKTELDKLIDESESK